MSQGLDRWGWLVPRPAKLFRLKHLRRALVGSLLCFLLLDLLFPLPPTKPYSQQVLARDGSLMRAFLTTDDKWRMEVSLDEVPKELPAALVAKEDRWFWWHPGVNPLAIARALWANSTSGERTSGASTITMQVARMLEPKPRTVGAKVQEMFRALQLEWHHDKTEILEMYMNYLPYGGNVEGVKAASHLYFQRPPAKLSLAQCLLLTVVPNRPNSLRPDHQATAARRARDKWLNRLGAQGLFPPDALHDALAEALPERRHPLKSIAPQFCLSARQGQSDTRLTTTIDPRMQLRTQGLLTSHVARLRSEGITNGAVLVVDNRTMEVMAYCGSADFNDKAADGEVDGVQAVRSPGSTLKPFIYAMAFDLGILTPHQKLLDIPTEFSDFSPVNYDRVFRGEVDAADALRWSLNLPAVRLLNTVGMRRFLHHLERAGFRSIGNNSKTLGLSLALGGCGATLEELVRAYAALANGGVMRPLRLTRAVTGDTTRHRVCSPEAAYMVSDILSGHQRPDVPTTFLDRSKLPKVAWKTGTSFGRRDAWSIGYNPRYTIGVWMGNMDGRPVSELSGSRTAVPLLLELFNTLDYDAAKDWLTPPSRIVHRMVCTETGLLPTSNCAHLRKDMAIRGVTREEHCSRYQLIYTDSLGTVQYCKACAPMRGYVERRVAMLSPELVLWMNRTGIPYPQPPGHNPACTAIFEGQGPTIHSPARDKTYYVEAGQEVMLQAAPDPFIRTHYWFVNDHYVGACPAGEKVFFAPTDGEFRISCIDDKGRVGATRLWVVTI